MTAAFDFDFLVLGGGSGGVRAARVAATFGARVALIEAARLGGTCVNVGCVPKKLMVYAASFASRFREASGFGWSLGAAPTFDWATLVDRREQEIRRLNGIYAGLLEGAGVHVFEGRGRFVGPRELEVRDGRGDVRRVSAATILVATGGRPSVTPIPGAELGKTSDDFFALRTQPTRAVVAGGGYIGVELASILRGLGTEVHLVHKNPTLLNAFDHDVRQFVGEQLQLHGVQLHLGRTIEALSRRHPRRRARARGGPPARGRRPRPEHRRARPRRGRRRHWRARRHPRRRRAPHEPSARLRRR